MKKWWQAQAARIDALSLRERAFLFLSVVACCMALADTLWLSPAQLQHKQLSQRFDKQSTELQRARDLLKTVALPSEAGKGASEELAAVNTRIDAVNQAIQGVVPATAQATPLAQVLVHLLRRHEGLTLLRTAALAPADAPTKAAGGPATPGTTLTRQGVELTVSGPYTELTRYVQTLEQALPAVRWGSLKLKSDKQPPELTLQLFLVGVPP